MDYEERLINQKQLCEFKGKIISCMCLNSLDVFLRKERKNYELENSENVLLTFRFYDFFPSDFT